ncbi:hypothetical protein [Lysinibacillus sp. BPa_S21]|uniref:hypothetical protein n=1 Tax=Lysinibacillus sp. BPa_S21 TaxID=2932478 RepID=UPI002012914E|nr:hypothetical protein [Lysinibacillus sp. BPa_S21]MCL1698317.1 hypothetical protein [Lysinibacillus sp. BPa_S21]
MNKLQMKEQMMAELEVLSTKRQAVREHVALISTTKENGRHKIAQLKEQIEAHKIQSESSTDLATVKSHLEEISSLTKDVEIQSLLNGKEIQALETMISPLIEETLAIHKDVKGLFGQLEKLFLVEMSISTMEEDVASINSISNEINNALRHMTNEMIAFKLIPHSSTSYSFAHSDAWYHIGQMPLYPKCNDLAIELKEFKYNQNL